MQRVSMGEFYWESIFYLLKLPHSRASLGYVNINNEHNSPRGDLTPGKSGDSENNLMFVEN